MQFDLKHKVPSLTCDVEDALFSVVCNSIANVIRRIITYLFASLNHYCPLSQPQWVKVQLLLDVARVGIDFDHAVDAKNIGPYESINKLKLVEQVPADACLVFHSELTELFQG